LLVENRANLFRIIFPFFKNFVIYHKLVGSTRKKLFTASHYRQQNRLFSGNFPALISEG